MASCRGVRVSEWCGGLRVLSADIYGKAMEVLGEYGSHRSQEHW